MILERFWKEQGDWSQKTFGLDSERGPIGSLKHLQKEVEEVLQDLDDKMEYIDCFFLIVDAIRRRGISIQEFEQLLFQKLEINKARKWGAKSSDGPVEHIRE